MMEIRPVLRVVALMSFLLYMYVLTLFTFQQTSYEHFTSEIREELLQLENRSKYVQSDYNIRKVKVEEDKDALTELLSVPFILDPKLRTIQYVHDMVYETLDQLQNEENCEEKKIIRCTYSGDGDFASIMKKYAICLQIAFATKRMYFIDYEPKYNNLGWFTELESTKCRFLKHKLSSIENKCNFNDARCKESVLQVNNSYKLLQLTDFKNLSSSRYIHGMMSKKMEEDLRESGVKNPILWFTSQFYGYMLRPSKVFKKRFNYLMRFVNIQKPAVGFAVQEGDVSTQVAALKVQTSLLTTARDIYVAGKKKVFIERLLNQNETRFHVKRIPELKSYSIKEYRDNTDTKSMRALVDLYILLQCDQIILSSQTSFGKLVLALKRAVYPYHTNHVIDLAI
ncbi:uncharacterized protein LOC130649132 isoform X1 [Hydractinia symbiolongicarpus]|uniref:uncharacterized protein LOC130649132 isoform X1 n=2 Tax=Hydractinia symbiolongicarpus TaxID=13093 RepID=UPI00254F3DD8|nr:uncharacterized protein LOC130649132 isoform X1 [Hydractinia symbiolongicarpus]